MRLMTSALRSPFPSSVKAIGCCVHMAAREVRRDRGSSGIDVRDGIMLPYAVGSIAWPVTADPALTDTSPVPTASSAVVSRRAVTHEWVCYLRPPATMIAAGDGDGDDDAAPFSSRVAANGDAARCVARAAQCWSNAIRCVTFVLNRTFTPNVYKRDRPPFEVRQAGWGEHMVDIYIEWQGALAPPSTSAADGGDEPRQASEAGSRPRRRPRSLVDSDDSEEHGSDEGTRASATDAEIRKLAARATLVRHFVVLRQPLIPSPQLSTSSVNAVAKTVNETDFSATGSDSVGLPPGTGPNRGGNGTTRLHWNLEGEDATRPVVSERMDTFRMEGINLEATLATLRRPARPLLSHQPSDTFPSFRMSENAAQWMRRCQPSSWSVEEGGAAAERRPATKGTASQRAPLETRVLVLPHTSADVGVKLHANLEWFADELVGPSMSTQWGDAARMAAMEEAPRLATGIDSVTASALPATLSAGRAMRRRNAPLLGQWGRPAVVQELRRVEASLATQFAALVAMLVKSESELTECQGQCDHARASARTVVGLRRS